MFHIPPRQATSIARFLEISRSHFGLPERRRFSRPRRHLRWAFLRLLLVVGSIGSLFGGTAFAEHDYKIARELSRREEPSVRAAPLAMLERPAKSAVESMP